jgi:hypothetical protein
LCRQTLTGGNGKRIMTTKLNVSTTQDPSPKSGEAYLVFGAGDPHSSEKYYEFKSVDSEYAATLWLPKSICFSQNIS